MIFYTITDTLPVVPDWSSITGDLKAGTPISIKGAVANGEAAIGLVAGDTAHGAEYAVVVTAGVVDLNAASASYGSTISDDVVQALDNVTFIYGGKVYAVSGSSLPDYSEASDGDVLGISSGEPGWVTPSSGGPELLRFDIGNFTGFYDSEGVPLTASSVYSELSSDPLKYVFMDVSGQYAPAFASVAGGDLSLHLVMVGTPGSFCYVLDAQFDPYDEYDYTISPGAITYDDGGGASGDEGGVGGPG